MFKINRVSRYSAAGDQQEVSDASVLGWGLPPLSPLSELEQGFLSHAAAPLCQGLFQACLWVMAIEKEAVPTGQVGWAQQILWIPIGCQQRMGTSTDIHGRPAGPNSTRHIVWLTPASLRNGLGLDLWSRSHTSSSLSPRLHHLVYLG